jgi:putative ABC transport system permease protein
MIKSVSNMRTMDPGFTTRDVFTARVGFPVMYTDTLAQRAFFTQLAERVAEIPGVQGAAISSGLPGARQGLGGTTFAIEGKSYVRESEYPVTNTLAVTPGFFATLDIPLVRGRLFESSDRAGNVPVAVVNERFAERHFDGADPIGRRIRYGGAQTQEPWMTIVGVVPNVYGGDNEDPTPPLVLRPFEQAHTNFNYISARTTLPPMSLSNPVRDAAAALNPDIPLYWLYSLDDAIAGQLWFIRTFGTMFMIFGVIALFLSAIGLYAVMSFSVRRRTREVGIRMALGAQARDVVRLIVGQGLLQVSIGLAAGLLLALGISRLLATILFDVQPRDPAVFGSVAAVLLASALLACLAPALRAMRVDPLTSLRAE